MLGVVLAGWISIGVALWLMRRLTDIDRQLRAHKIADAPVRPSRWPSLSTDGYHAAGWPLIAQRNRAYVGVVAFAIVGVLLLADVCPGLATRRPEQTLTRTL